MGKDLKYNLKLDNSAFKRGMEEAGSLVTDLKDELLKFAGAYAAFDFLKDSVKSFMEAEMNSKRLSMALKGNKEDLEALQNQASELQEIGIFSDDDIMKAQTYGKNVGLTTDAVKAIIPTLADWAAATKGTAKDVGGVEGAMGHFIKALNGGDKLLTQLGYTFDKTKSDVENFNDIVKLLTSTYGNANKELAETTWEGKLANLTNQIDEFKETVGKNVLDVLVNIFDFVKEHIVVFELLAAVIGGALVGALIASTVEFVASTAAAFSYANVTTFITLVTEEGLIPALYAVGVTGAAAWALVTGGITLIIGGLVLAYNKVDWFKKLVWGFGYGAMELFRALKEEFLAIWDFTNFEEHITEAGKHMLNIGNAFNQGRADASADIAEKAKKEEEEKNKVYNPYANNKTGAKVFETGRGPSERSEKKPSDSQQAKENITINITKLVETIELHTMTLKEGSDEIKKEMALALTEALASVKYMTR